ncbi:uncharacterized protein EDB93DRAFT_52664 [Suillus bovinus]|uniref:uncharacterized protein n=1 Tax=Suillus bovinus TaxID=48563 RepID=UPI001B865EC8|nr:uncharacterized protein EDB93DRAFT_52664 [Suillus bovinus]KAG2155801.1 hypothetical protein EDB93DRAFT_52664 [Suillus bovinus]
MHPTQLSFQLGCTSTDLGLSISLALSSCILSFTVAQNPVDTYAPIGNVLNTSETEYIASRESYVIAKAWSNWCIRDRERMTAPTPERITSKK